MRPKRRSISLRRLWSSVSYYQGSRRDCSGGPTRSNASDCATIRPSVFRVSMSGWRKQFVEANADEPLHITMVNLDNPFHTGRGGWHTFMRRLGSPRPAYRPMTRRAPAWHHAAGVIVLLGGAGVDLSSTGPLPTAWFEGYPPAAFDVMAGTASVSGSRGSPSWRPCKRAATPCPTRRSPPGSRATPTTKSSRPQRA